MTVGTSGSPVLREHGRADVHSRVTWHRPSSSVSSQSVEVAWLDDGHVSIRDSRDPEGVIHTFDADEWHAFVLGVKAGEFDYDLDTPALPTPEVAP